MTAIPIHNGSLFSRGMTAVLVAQFFSALADNALLFAAIAMLKFMHAPDWQMPLLQEFFAVAFILLAPFVGPFADSWPKGRVMLAANAMKFAGAVAMLFGLHPLLAYNLVGIGAAAYSPAKYGILSELVGADKLVKANSMMEGSTIVAILLGAAAAAKFVTLKTINRALPAGILIGLLIPVFAHATSLPLAVILLVLIGASGGFYVVPLNALLQERGHETVGAGHAIAVQNVFENFAMIVMVGLYTLMVKAGMDVITSASLFGLVVFSAIGALAWLRVRKGK